MDKIIKYSSWIIVVVFISTAIWLDHRADAGIAKLQQKATDYITVVKSKCKLVGTGRTLDSTWALYSADVYECAPGNFRIINTQIGEAH